MQSLTNHLTAVIACPSPLNGKHMQQFLKNIFNKEFFTWGFHAPNGR